jgi:hypothetical protein
MLPATPAPIATPSPAPERPCKTAAAAALGNRPGTGNSTASNGAACVVPRGELVVESGWRRELTWQPGYSVLGSGPLTLLRYGIAHRLELGIAPPANQSLFVEPGTQFESARGTTDAALDLKYIFIDQEITQASVDLTYSPPTGTGEFANGLPTYAISGNVAFTLSDRWSFAMSQQIGTNTGSNAAGLNVTYFDYTPSYTFAYALTGATNLLTQVALESRQGPVEPSGNRAFFAVQQVLGDRLAIDLDFERNLKPTVGLGPQQALGFGFVWIAAPARSSSSRAI